MAKLFFQLAIEIVLVAIICSFGGGVFKSWLLQKQDYRSKYNDDRQPRIPVWNHQVFMEPERESRYPIVLWWIPFSRTPRIIKTCKLGTCLFTHSRTEINNTLTKDIIFYGTGLQWDDIPLPRNPAQTWSLLHEESPKNAWSLTSPEVISLFNHTATCSRFSSFPLTMLSLNSLKQLLSPMRTPNHLKSKGEHGLVMYLHSGCDTPSDRDSYVAELMKYIVVDSYGHCLHNTDLPTNLRDTHEESGHSSQTEILDLMSKYKFVLTFENAICDDYITEKLWRIFEAGSVPVYKGSPSVKDWTPNDHSVILVDEFSSPAHLAHYLLLLDEDSEEYNSYFDYKKEGITNKRLVEHMDGKGWTLDVLTNKIPNFIQAFECHICDSIHKRERRLQKGETVKPAIADGTHYHCPSLRPSLQLTSRSDLKEYHGRESMKLWKRVTTCEEMKGKMVAQAISKGAGKEKIREVLKEVSGKCSNLEISEDWMLNRYNLNELVHTPVSIGMCKDLE